ncbi:coupling of ubiquitin conjugation to er degradation protein 1 [Emericellopsis cladophorae]|uniref:Coupling of ubiquitin conjugation to er degradation protein 1 n=1 Tax=Emericellopsis cladophorae TaxID=2686198 RepID=A0A9P9Y7Y3_9HYPO|nr:coupling of ubiquitin conjugation to er degradation protein 1 [Emericellopsis cladophorae]KAI6785141.1 coupling of ubiquitin conjugation to er degradation protein 1 [Emericellopsis cladophorae]
MSDDQISLPYFAAILIILGFIARYLFFNGGGASAAQSPRSPEALLRARETAVERIQQMFPQTERRTILWDLHRNGMNIQNTTERILAGRLETPPITFQPPAPPPPNTTSASSAAALRKVEKPSQPDLITRYNLTNRITSSTATDDTVNIDSKTKAWSSNRDERQASLQKRREDMILAARRKMEAKLAKGKST